MKNLLKKISRLGQGNKLIEAQAYGLPENHRLYCIGDIHGRDDLLRDAHQKIAADATGFTGKKTRVYLGDYVDRGMNSKEVLEILLANELTGFEQVYLLGNHEQVLLEFLLTENSEVAQDWIRFGGLQTLLSYGVRVLGIPTPREWPAVHAQFKEKLPEAHLQFLASLQLSYEVGGYFFVHAGIRPGVKLHQQLPEDMLWIRDEFLNSRACHGKIIVHGHSVTDEPDVRPNRIGLDTGAYASGKLTCAVFEGASLRFL